LLPKTPKPLSLNLFKWNSPGSQLKNKVMAFPHLSLALTMQGTGSWALSKMTFKEWRIKNSFSENAKNELIWPK